MIGKPMWYNPTMIPLPPEIAVAGIRPATIYMVGGSVRDLLLGRPALDTDLAVTAEPADFARRLADRLSGSYVQIGKSDLTIHRVVVGDRIFDVSALHGAGIEEDLRRRDFTVNALAVDAATGEVVDCTGGRKDLQAGIIRMVSTAAFRSDPVRLLRAYRLAAALGFDIDPVTESVIAGNAARIGQSAGERIWAELRQILAGPSSLTHLERMQASGLLTAILPEIGPLDGCHQGGHHRWDVWTHSLRAYGHLESMLNDTATWLPAGIDTGPWRIDDHRASLLKLAMLLHDVGKPSTRQVDDSGHVHFYGHGKKSAEIAAGIAARLKLSNRQAGYLDFIIRSHIRPLHLFNAFSKGQLTVRAKTRFFIHCGRHTPDLLLHAMADIEGKGNAQPRDRKFIEFARQLLGEYIGDYLPRSAHRPLLGGRDLMDTFGLQPSPLLGRLLREIEQARLSNEIRTRDEALALAEALVAKNRRK